MVRKIQEKDRKDYIELAMEFYGTNAVLYPIPRENIEKTFDELMRSDVYAEGYILESGGKTAGYALLAKSFSQEAGGKVIWLEELFIRTEFRKNGLGSEFLRYVEEAYSETARFRLEVEPENTGAVTLYKRLGYKELPYCQFAKEYK